MNCPTAVPKLPVPSIMPAIVEVAFELLLTIYCYPKSAAHDDDSIFANPFSKNPNKNKHIARLATLIDM
jgi:hypothetical protein